MLKIQIEITFETNDRIQAIQTALLRANVGRVSKADIIARIVETADLGVQNGSEIINYFISKNEQNV